MEGSFSLIWIPLFPLLAAVINLVFGRMFMRSFGTRVGREIIHLVAIGAVAFSCFITMSAVFDGMIEGGFARLVDRVYPWIVSGETSVAFELMMDPLAAVMTFIATFVGLLIHIFSVGYMEKEPAYHRYFGYLNLFMGSMLILVLGKSLALMFVGWEGVGLCSYLLIGFWFDDEVKATAGRKAFVMNRIGDFGFILGMLLIYMVTKSLDVDAIRMACASGERSPFVTTMVAGVSVATVATLLLFLGCTGKSAQLPLFTWLPDAMAGPTPVSALIHAATMVTAGVYLIVRLNFLFALAPLTMAVIALVGTVTAVFAATIGITQNDIKKVLAYSTVSQLGFMFIAAGVGAWVAAIFHLMTHAFFKACLFLGAGSVIDACHHEQDIRKLGGLRKKMPWTAGTFFVSCLAIAGIFPFSGFFSKDEILLHAYVNESAWSPGLSYFCYGVGVLTALCTAFYMGRLYFLTFEGKFRGDRHTWDHVEEQSIMYGPLVILAFLATVAGAVGLPHVFGVSHVLHEWLRPVIALSSAFRGDYAIGPKAQFVEHGHVSTVVELVGMAVGLTAGIAGLVFARMLYREGPSALAQRFAVRLAALYRASLDKYWVDEIYDRVIVRPMRALAHVCYRVVDVVFVDGAMVYGTAGLVGGIGNGVRRLHNGNVRRYLLWLLFGVGLVLGLVYANPDVAQLGPSPVHTIDAGGLRPTLKAPKRSGSIAEPLETPEGRDG